MTHVSNLFVCVMGMGVTFVGLICIIFLITLMGRIMGGLEKKTAPVPAAAPAAAAPAAPAAAPSDGVSEEVRVAILAALMQQPGFRLEQVARIDIRRV